MQLKQRREDARGIFLGAWRANTIAATTAIYRYTGGSPTGASVAGGIKFSRDDANNGTTPVPIPPTGSDATNFSFNAVCALYVTAAVGSAISNKRLYRSGSMPTGMMLYHNTEGTSPATSTTYTQGAQVSATATTVGTPPTGYVAMTTSTSGTAYDSTGAGSAINSAGIAGKYVSILFGVDQTASTTGNVTLPTINLLYDEQ